MNNFNQGGPYYVSQGQQFAYQRAFSDGFQQPGGVAQCQPYNHQLPAQQSVQQYSQNQPIYRQSQSCNQ